MSRRARSVIRAALLAGGGVFIAAGVMRGEMKIVFSKAVRICLECIGIG